MVLRPLVRRALSTEHSFSEPVGPVRRGVRHGRTQCELLPVAQGRDVRGMASTTTHWLRNDGEGASRPHALSSVDLARALDRALLAVLDGARRAPRRLARAIASRAATGRLATRALPRSGPRQHPRGAGTAPPILGRSRGVRIPAPSPRGLRRNEWRRASVHSPCDHRYRVRTDARTGPGGALRRLLQRAPSWRLGPNGLRSGTQNIATCTSTSTTTVQATRCRMQELSSGC